MGLRQMTQRQRSTQSTWLNLVLAALITLSLLPSCSDEIGSVTVSADITDGSAPLLIVFQCSAQGGDALRYRWDFGDGGHGDSAEASHTYLREGSFGATCTAYDESGSRSSEPIQVTVRSGDAPSIAIHASSTEGMAPLEVTFSAAIEGADEPASVEWNFGDGETDSESGDEVTHTFTAAGEFNVLVTVTDTDLNVGRETIEVIVAAPQSAPDVSVSLEEGECAVPGFTTVSVQGTAEDAEDDELEYEWVFVSLPAGSLARFNSAHVAAPTFVPDITGMYSFRLFVSDGVHTVASDVLEITADGVPASVAIEGGDGQTGEAGSPADDRLLARVDNSCGEPIPGARIDWYPHNAWPNPQFSETNAIGVARTRVSLGTQAGEGTVTATAAPGVSATFTQTVEAGEPAVLLMEEVPRVQVTDDGPVTLTFQLRDAFSNPLTEPDLTFDLALVANGGDLVGHLDSADSGVTEKTDIALEDGRATVRLYSEELGSLFVVASNISEPGVVAGGLEVLATEDFENDGGSWTLTQPLSRWEVGEPLAGPDAAHSGSQLLGTRLDGEFDADTASLGGSAKRRFNVSHPRGVQALFLRYWQWYDMSMSLLGCTVAKGIVSSGSTGVSPLENYPGPYQCTAADSVYGFGGKSDGWGEVVAPLPASNFDLTFTFWAGDSNGELPVAEGWYIDDIELVGVVGATRVRFHPGPPDSGEATLVLDGVSGETCSRSGRVRFEFSDELGNPIEQSTPVALALDGDATFSSSHEGHGFETEGASATIGASSAGAVDVSISSSADDPVTVTATAGEVSIHIEVAFDPAPSAETGLCDDAFDNDCDEAINCDDEDCRNDPSCPEADCFDGNDNDSDGHIDCEDSDCRDGDEDGGDCDSGIDPFDVCRPQAAGESLWVLPMSCRCAVDVGCDGLNTNLGDLEIDDGLTGSYAHICHPGDGGVFPGLPDTGGVCAPNCQTVLTDTGFDLCSLADAAEPPLECGPDGECIAPEVSE